MSRAGSTRRVAASGATATAAAGGLVLLLQWMRREFLDAGRLTVPTAVAVYGA